MKDMNEYTIGDALEQLRPEFPDLTQSSLRFLEREGLVQPDRTKGGHRKYSAQDISRIRLIKRLQSNRHYPLEIIRHMLVKLEGARDVETEIAFLESLFSPLSYDPDYKPLTREQLSDRVGLPVPALSRLVEMGLLFPFSNGNGRQYFDEDDVKMAELVTRELGLGAGIEDFAPYAAAMEKLMREEFALYYRLTAGGEPSQERTRQLKETSDIVHAMLRAKLTRRMLMQAVKPMRGKPAHGTGTGSSAIGKPR